MRAVHVPFCFHPDPIGGTEVYVAALAKALVAQEVEAVIAAPAAVSKTYSWHDLLVRRFATRRHVNDLRELYGEGDDLAAREFARILDEEDPDIVHLHSFTMATSLRLVNEVKRRRIPLVYTYHTPTASCQRGDMMRWGVEPCAGVMDLFACSRCTLAGLLGRNRHGRNHMSAITRIAANAVGSLPPGLGRFLSKRGLKGGAWTALRMTELVQLRHAVTRELFEQVDHIVAVCDWVKHVLLRNGVPESKISLCRQGVLSETVEGGQNAPASSHIDNLKICLLGRYDATKGMHLPVQAVRALPDAPVRLDIYGLRQGESGLRYETSLRELAAGDDRIQFVAPVAPDAVVSTLREYDLLAVPSQWLETGPLVVMEAFAAGIPVIGSKLGGIAELVRDGVDGLLVSPASSPAAWQEALQRLASDPDLINRLRAGVRPPRTINDVAMEMAALYHRFSESSRRRTIETRSVSEATG